MIAYYKVRHKPTGLFFKPSTKYKRENLDNRGKTYTTKPKVRPICAYIDSERIETTLEDWEIVIFETIETGTLPIEEANYPGKDIKSEFLREVD